MECKDFVETAALLQAEFPWFAAPAELVFDHLYTTGHS
jgi:hypothetical protein